MPLGDANPFQTPTADVHVAISTEHDRYIEAQVAELLEPGEVLRFTVFLTKAPSLWLQMLFSGLIMLLFIKPYLAAITNRRVILIRTKNGFVRPAMKNLGVEEIRWSDVETLKVGGIANNRSIDFVLRNGAAKRTLRIAPWLKFVSGNKPFFEQVQHFDAQRFDA